MIEARILRIDSKLNTARDNLAMADLRTTRNSCTSAIGHAPSDAAFNNLCSNKIVTPDLRSGYARISVLEVGNLLGGDVEAAISLVGPISSSVSSDGAASCTVVVNPGQQNTWFGLSDANDSGFTPGGFDSFVIGAQTSAADWAPGPLVGSGSNSTCVVNSLPSGTYQISLSCSIANGSSPSTSMQIAVGILDTAGVGGFSVGATPFMLTSTNVLIGARGIAGGTAGQSLPLACSGLLTLNASAQNVGIAIKADDTGVFELTNVQLTIRSLE